MLKKFADRFGTPFSRYIREQDKGFPGKSVSSWRSWPSMTSWIAPMEGWRGEFFQDFPRYF